jgi:transposase
MKVYIGIDLHGDNVYVAVMDERGRVLYERKLNNELGAILQALEPYRKRCAGVVVESTFNWYWLVDGLMESGFEVHLANPAGNQQYSGKKFTDDRSDARWLAELLRLGILREGAICPREDRAVRDLLRKRGQLVRQASSNVLSIQNLYARNLGRRLKTGEVRKLTTAGVDREMAEPALAMAVKSALAVLRAVDGEVARLEAEVLSRVSVRPGYALLLGVPGVGKILALTIMLETGTPARFSDAGHYASYCRCVEAKATSNGKKKGGGNEKCGNRYLAWAYIEAAHFAVRFYPKVHAFYERKKAKRNGVVALKAVAHKLARASYHVLADQAEFGMERAFA